LAIRFEKGQKDDEILHFIYSIDTLIRSFDPSFETLLPQLPVGLSESQKQDTLVANFKINFESYKQNYTNLLNTAIAQLNKKTAEEYSAIIQVFKDLSFNNQLRLLPNNTIKIAALESENRYRAKIQLEYNLNVARVETIDAPTKMAISDQGFPSQSEIIDALAIYISRRFKQEVVMTFMETFIKNIKNNQFAQELFPAMYTLLDNRDPYSLPSLGTDWRNALSKDLAMLPENLVNSNMLKNWIQNRDVRNYLSDGVLIAKFMSKKYTFIDMIRTLHDNTDIGLSTEKIQTTHVKNAIDIAFVINQDLFDSLSTRYWISPEELYRLQPEEINFLGALINKKHEAILTPSVKKMLLDPTKLLIIQKKITNLLSILKQFEGSQLSLRKMTDASTKNMLWEYLQLFMDFLSKEVPDPNVKSNMELVKEVFNIYDNISSKNFGAAINASLMVTDKLLKVDKKINYLGLFTGKTNALAIENFFLSQPNISDEDARCLTEMENLSKLMVVIGEHKTFPYTDAALKTDFVKKYKTEIPADVLTSRFYASIITRSSAIDSDNFKSFASEILLIQREIVRSHTGDDIKFFDKIQLYTPLLLKDFQDYCHVAERFAEMQPSPMLQSITKITRFLTDASSARNSNDLSNVLQSYAQPPLSYKLIRRSVSSININAYLGAWFGLESPLTSVKIVDKTQNLNDLHIVAGLTVPLGISFTWGNSTENISSVESKIHGQRSESNYLAINKRGKSKYYTGSSHTIFLSIVDIVGPVSFRLGNDTANGLPRNTLWSQVLAPGVHYMYGIRNSPLCLNFGFQVSPQLRSFENVSIKPFSTWRIQVGLVYDMPLLLLNRKNPF
jgi:hypothetical protein